MRARLLLVVLALLLGTSPALGAGDDYPAEYRNGDPATQFDRWGYIVRTTQSFTAWRLEQRGLRVRYSEGWGLAIQTSISLSDFQAMVAPYIGAQVDQVPSPDSLALWPATGGQPSYTEWVVSVNADGSTMNETYWTNVGYRLDRSERAPWYIHLPGSGGPGGGVVGTPDPQPPVAQPPAVTTRPFLRVFAFSRQKLVVTTNLSRPRLVTITITGKGRKVTIRRVISASRRQTVLKVKPKLPQGVYVVTLTSAADGIGPALTLRAYGRKTA